MPEQKLELSDKIREYLLEYNKKILFDELSDDYLKRANAFDILHGIPVPITPDGGDHITTLSIAMGMARVIGADPSFRYTGEYIRYLERMYGDGCVKVLISEGAKAGESGHYELACIYFRAALQIRPSSRDALYLYGRACKDAYETEGKDEEYVGKFKAQSIDIFEELTIRHPKYCMGYYFLGYSYANMGLYTKARITWEEFMNLSRGEDADEEETNMNPVPDEDMQSMREEIRNRLRTLEDPIRIEEACNHVLSGDYLTGISILSEYETGPYSKWWPLWYYLGVAYTGIGDSEHAISSYRNALQLSPSNIQVMMELIDVYQATGDYANAEKYIDKVHVIERGLAQETENAQPE